MTTLVVTRHPALVQYLKEKGYIPSNAQVLEHASADDVRGKHVWGVLPHSLSVLTRAFTEIPMNIPAEKRGVELTLDDMLAYAGEPVTYVVGTPDHSSDSTDLVLAIRQYAATQGVDFAVACKMLQYANQDTPY